MLQKLREYVPHNIICHHCIPAQASRIFIKNRRVKLKDLYECIPIHSSRALEKCYISYQGMSGSPVRGMKNDRMKLLGVYSDHSTAGSGANAGLVYGAWLIKELLRVS